MDEVLADAKKARALNKKRKYDDAIELLKDCRDRMEKIDRHKLQSELELKHSYEKLGSLIEAYHAAKYVVAAESNAFNNKRFVELLIRVKYNKEAMERLALIKKRFGCEQWKKDMKIAMICDFDTNFLFEPRFSFT